MHEKGYRLIRIDESNITVCERLFFDVFNGEPFNYSWLTIEKARRYCSDLMKTPNFFGFLYEKGNITVAGCLGTVNDYFNSKFYDIKEIFVKREMQRGGIGTLMLKEMETVLAAMGLEAVTLFTQKSIPAYKFYLKNNYLDSDDVAYFCKGLK